MMGICFLLSTDAIVMKKSKTKQKNAKNRGGWWKYKKERNNNVNREWGKAKPGHRGPRGER